MFENLNGWEIIVLALLGLFIFGPERLPKVISDGVRMLRNLRDLARNATDDLSREMGTDVRLEDLHPKTFIRKHLLSEDEERELRRPFDEVFRDVRQISTEAADGLNGAVTEHSKADPERSSGSGHRYDADAT
jgi:sec-independent protein translocase protein TatB